MHVAAIPSIQRTQYTPVRNVAIVDFCTGNGLCSRVTAGEEKERTPLEGQKKFRHLNQ